MVFSNAFRFNDYPRIRPGTDGTYCAANLSEWRIPDRFFMDYDGVFSNSLDELMKQAHQVQREMGVGKPPEEEFFRTAAPLTFGQIAKKMDIPTERIPEFCGRIKVLQDANTNVAPIFEGMADVARELSSYRPIELVTATYGKQVDRFLREHGIRRNIAQINGADNPLPKWRKIQQSCAMHHIPPGRASMTGDSGSDISAGRMAYVPTVGVLWGVQHLHVLQAQNPRITAATPGELRDILLGVKGDLMTDPRIFNN